MPTQKSSTTRRREARRGLSRETSTKRWQFGFRPQTGWAALTVFLLSLLVTLLAVQGREADRFRVGAIAPETRMSRVAFKAIDPERTAAAARRMSELEPVVYTPNRAYLNEVERKLIEAGELAADPRYPDLNSLPPQRIGPLKLNDDKLLRALQAYVKREHEQRWQQRVSSFVDALMRLPVMKEEDAQREKQHSNPHLAIVISIGNGDEQKRLFSEIVSVAEKDRVRSLIIGEARTLFPDAPEIQQWIAELITDNLKPFVTYDRAKTQQRKQTIEQDVLKNQPVHVEVKRNDVLIKAGTQLSKLDVALLEKEAATYQEEMGAWHRWMIRGCTFAIVLLVLSGFWLYVGSYNRRAIDNPLRGLALGLLLLFCQAVAVFGTGLDPRFAFAAGVFPALLCTIVLAITYEQRFALAAGLVYAIIATFSLDMSIGFFLVLATGVIVSVRQLPDVRTRTKLLWVGLWTGVAVAAATTVVGVVETPAFVLHPYRTLLTHAALAFVTAFVSGLMIQGLLPAIEVMFQVTTAMTLKELNDASHPLLHRLAQTAPGTYQHSLRLSDMSEAAAETIGANSLLCKVGAMYHDIGKINKPAYFIENQSDGQNRHDKLSPAMSLLIIVGHVKDGIEMAREAGLPRGIRHIIESHHGTTLVAFFYHQALQQSEAENTNAPSEFEFRYPGPKPRSKEAAIMMLCDSIESAARTLREPTPLRLEQLTHDIAQARLMDGQFDECALTLQELHQIEQSIHKTLCAIYHHRVSYPGKDESKQSKAQRDREADRSTPREGQPAATAEAS